MEFKFSIIVPIYGVEKYIHKCINSVLCQNYHNFELILVDDESPDSCPQICDQYVKKDKRVVVVHKKNGGASDARNVGIEKATGDYILFLDGDDYWLNVNVLEVVNKRLNQFKSDVICLNYKKIYETGKEIVYFSLKNNMPRSEMGRSSINYIIQNNVWTSAPWNKAIKKNLFENRQLNFVKGTTAEDIDWCARLVLFAHSYDFVKIPCIGYRQRNASISRAITCDKVKCLYNNILETEKVVKVATEEKRELLLKYLSYQYGSLVKNISLLQSQSQRRYFSLKIKFVYDSMKYSNSRKIKVLRFATKLIGVRGTIEVLHLMEVLKRGKNKNE